MLSLENKNTKVNGSNKIRSLNQNFKARLKDKLGFTLNPYTLVNNALRCKKSGSLQFKSELIEEVTSNLIKDNRAASYDSFAYNYFTKLLFRQKCTEINCDDEALDRYKVFIHDDLFHSSFDESFCFKVLDCCKGKGTLKTELICNFAHFMLDKGDFTPLSSRYDFAKNNADSADERALAVIFVSHLLQDTPLIDLDTLFYNHCVKDSNNTEKSENDDNGSALIPEKNSILKTDNQNHEPNVKQDPCKFSVDDYGLSEEGHRAYLQFLYICSNRLFAYDLIENKGIHGKFKNHFGSFIAKEIALSQNSDKNSPLDKVIVHSFIYLEKYLFKTDAIHDIILFVNEIKSAIEEGISESELSDLVSSKKALLLNNLLSHRKEITRSTLYVLRLVRDCLLLTYLLQGNDASLKANRLYNYLKDQSLKARYSSVRKSYDRTFGISLAKDYIRESTSLNPDNSCIELTAVNADDATFTKTNDSTEAPLVNVNSQNPPESGCRHLNDALYDIPVFRAFILKKMVLLSPVFKDCLDLFLSVHGTGDPEFESFINELSGFDFIFNDPDFGKITNDILVNSSAYNKDEKGLLDKNHGKNLLLAQYENLITTLKCFYKLIEHTVDIFKDNTIDDGLAHNHDGYYSEIFENENIETARKEKVELKIAQGKEKAVSEALMSIAAFMRAHYLPYDATSSNAYKKLVYCMVAHKLPLMRIDGYKGKESLYPSYVINHNKSAINALYKDLLETNLPKSLSSNYEYEIPSYLIRLPESCLSSKSNVALKGKVISLDPLMTVYDKQFYQSLYKSAFLKYLCATGSMEVICEFIDKHYKVGNCEDVLMLLDCLHIYCDNYLKTKVTSQSDDDYAKEINLISIALSFCIESAQVCSHDNNGIYRSNCYAFRSYKGEEISELLNSRLSYFYFTHQYVFCAMQSVKNLSLQRYQLPVTEDAANVAYLVKALCEHDVKDALYTLELLPYLPGYTFMKSYLKSLQDKTVKDDINVVAQPLQVASTTADCTPVFEESTVVYDLIKGKYGNVPLSLIYQSMVFYQLRQDSFVVKNANYAQRFLKTTFFNSFYMPEYDYLLKAFIEHRKPRRFDGEYFNEYSLLFTVGSVNSASYCEFSQSFFKPEPDYLEAVPAYFKAGSDENNFSLRLSSRYAHELFAEKMTEKERKKQRARLEEKIRSHGIDPNNCDYLKRDDGKTHATSTNSKSVNDCSFHITGNRKLQDYLYDHYLKDFEDSKILHSVSCLAKEYGEKINDNGSSSMKRFSIAHKRANLVLFGEHGSGKTKAVEILLKALNIKEHKINLASLSNSGIHDFAKNITEQLKNIDTRKPTVVVMENVDAYFSDVRYVSDHNDWTIEEVNATKQAIEDIEKKNCFVIMTANYREKIDSGLLDLFPNTFEISRSDADDIVDCFTSSFSRQELSLSCIKNLSTQLEGMSLNSVFKFIKMVKAELALDKNKKGRFNFDLHDTLNALLKKFLGFTLDKDAFFSLPGQTELENFINDNFIDYIKYPEKYQRFKLKMLDPIMLYGAPGTGKTYAANALAKFLGWKFFTIDATQYEQNSVGSAKKITEIFNKAKDAAPSIVFIDEADSMFAKRRSWNNNEGISQFLRSISDTAKDRVLVIAATNRIDDMDEAILRNGRFSNKIEISYADTKGVLAVMEEYLKDKPVSNNLSLIKAVSKLSGHPLCDTKSFLDSVCKEAAWRDSNKIEQCDVDEALLHLNLTRIEDNYSYRETTHKRAGFI